MLVLRDEVVTGSDSVRLSACPPVMFFRRTMIKALGTF